MADNESAVIIGSIILDTEAPTGYIYINSDASSTSTETVTLNINAIDAGVVSEMMISNHFDFSGASWGSYATTSVWTLLSGDGTKEVFIKFRDIVMNVSTTYSDTIQLIKG